MNKASILIRLSSIFSISKYRIFIVTLASLLMLILLFLALALKYEDRISKKIGIDISFSHLLIDPISQFLPELFFKRNRRVIWHTSNASSDIMMFGYVDKHSILPGQTFRVMLSTGPDENKVEGHIEIYRVGYNGDRGNNISWRSGALTVSQQETHDSAASIGLMWKPAIVNVQTNDWKSGFYDIDFITNKGKKYPHVASIVVIDPSFTGDILVKLATNTYQAYNSWGGHSLYRSDLLGKGQRGYMVSFDRPIPNQTFHNFYTWEHHLVTWLEKLAHDFGLSVHYATNFDVSINPTFTDNYTLLISSGHDEYWTKEEFENTYRRIFTLGKNTMFLGANTAFWQVRYADVNAGNSSEQHGRQMICYKSLDDPIKFRMKTNKLNSVTARFRDASRRPETMLMGIGYQWFGNRNQKYFVNNTNFPFFDDTGYSKGEIIGNIVGHEWDNTDPEGDGKRLFLPGISNIPELPKETINILFEGPTIGKGGKVGKAEAIYFLSHAGAKVFSSGTNDWVKGLIMDGVRGEKFRKFNQNLIFHFLDREKTEASTANK